MVECRLRQQGGARAIFVAPVLDLPAGGGGTSWEAAAESVSDEALLRDVDLAATLGCGNELTGYFHHTRTRCRARVGTEHPDRGRPAAIA